MDFAAICSREIEKGPNKGNLEIFPDFRVGRSRDLMVRGRAFYAIWDEENKLWSTDEYDVQRLLDAELYLEADKLEKEKGVRPKVKSLASHGTNSWMQFRKYIQNISDNSHPLDEEITFADSDVKKTDYVSKRLPYSLSPGDYSAWDELIGTLYNVEERAKLEWAIGAVVSGDAKKIQKFLVLYGAAGTGKSTYLDVVAKLFEGYTAMFDAKALGSSSAAFATEVFKNNPLVAIQHDGDLSKIEDNTKLNSIISHEDMPMNEKYKPGYTARVNAFLFMGTNSPVKISDAKSGLLRRLIDVHPTGVTIPTNHYHALISKIDFELGAIAQHCLDVYRKMGKNFYNSYRPVEMMFQTDIFYNFIESVFDILKEQDGVTLKQAWELYKAFCADTGIEKPLPQYKIRGELENYFDKFHDRGELNGVPVRSVYLGFNANKFKSPVKDVKDDIVYSLVLEEETSLLDTMLAEMPAQYGTEVETPIKSWANTTSKLSELDTKRLHFVQVPPEHIVIDFDLKDENGDKSLERNLQAASEWPPTYAELSKGGAGVHLHYIYDGDADELNPLYSQDIEVKVYRGNASLRRRLSKCNNVPVATINSGLPLKEKKSVNSEKTMQSERSLRDLIGRNLRKEIHSGTKPSIDFIAKILDEAYKNGMQYDVTDLRPKIIAFANNSSNQPLQALKVVQGIKWKSEDAVEAPFGDDPVSDNAEPNRVTSTVAFVKGESEKLVFFDIEVYPNLFVVCWKFEGPDAVISKMVNPKAAEIEQLLKLKLVGYNNRRYDNHILYAAFMGYGLADLYALSQKIIDNDRSGMFGEAYGLSYADIYDFTSLKQSLKKYQIELGLAHVELDIPWDKPVPPELVQKVVDYCCNDVVTTEATFHARKQDFVARQILADLSGETVNDPTNKHTAKIIFGNERNPQKQFVYTDLSKMFPGYEFNPMVKVGKSSYRGEDPSEGGYVYAEPGIYENVAVLDVASMHPTSIINLNLFGDEFTPRFKELLDARIAIKRKQYDRAKTLLGGKLAQHLDSVDDAKALSYALKIVINIVYGMTSATFANQFRDPRNIDNIVAKRGALFMIDLKHFVQEKGFQVVHIKTDSIKIPNATPEIIQEVQDFGQKYGYEFEHEVTYDKFALVNNAVYIARAWDGLTPEGDKKIHWDATGAQFQHPYVYKKLFSGEKITFDDLCETKQVQKGTMYLDFTGVKHEKDVTFNLDDLVYIGKHGQFTPVKPEVGGALWRIQEGKPYAVSGTKDYTWMESTRARQLDVSLLDMTYFEDLCTAAETDIGKFGSFKDFVN
jgi:hypothetical protein